MKPYYEEDGITIFHADNREILPNLSGIDMVLTSPPYNLGNVDGSLGHGAEYMRQGTRPTRTNCKWRGELLAGGYGAFDDNMPREEYALWQQNTLRLCWNALSDTGAIYYNHKPRVIGTDLWTPLELNPGLPLRQIIIWARAGCFNCSPTFYAPAHEWLLVLAKPEFRLRDKSASGVSDVWQIAQESNTTHPAPFPLKLATRAISTTRAKVVCDPFCGSGTALLSAKQLGLKAIGIDTEERFCEMAARRLAQTVMDFGEAA